LVTVAGDLGASSAMWDRVLPWALRLAWVALPFTAWPAVAEALRHHHGDVRPAVAIAGWVVWGAVLLATLVPHPLGLTVLRSSAPAVAAAVVVSAATGRPSTPAVALAVAWACGVTTLAFLPSVGVLFVNGPAYANERRYPLSPPGALLLGPVELAWVITAGLPAAAVLLLGDRHWVAGAIAAVLGLLALRFLGAALHRLSLRWVVFVPAGLVIHDAMSLAEPVLFRRQTVAGLGLAAPGAIAVDLTQGAPGPALELRLGAPVTVGRAHGPRRPPEEVPATALLFRPSRPGAVLAEAARRRLPVQAAAPPPRTSSPS
jgi:hypothetical protein